MKELESKNWIKRIDIATYIPPIFSKKEKAEIFKTIEDKLKKNQINIAENYIFFILLSEENYFFKVAKKKGIFRINQISYKNDIDKILKSILKHCRNTLKKENSDYLESMINLHKASSESHEQ